MAVTGKENAKASNVKASFKRLLSDSKLAQTLRKNMGLGDTTGPLAVEHGGTGAEDRDGIMLAIRMNNTSRGFFVAESKKIEYVIEAPQYYGSAFINTGYMGACTARGDDGILYPVIALNGSAENYRPAAVIMVTVTEDGAASQETYIEDSLTTKGNKVYVCGNPKHGEDGSIRWVFEICGGINQGINNSSIETKTASLIDVYMTEDGAVNASLIMTLDGYTMKDAGQRYGSVSVDEDGSMLLATSDYDNLRVVLVSKDRAFTVIEKSSLKGDVPNYLFETGGANYFDTRGNRQGGINVIQRAYRSNHPWITFDDGLNVIEASTSHDEGGDIPLYFNNYQPYFLNTANVKTAPTGATMLTFDESGRVLTKAISPIDGIKPLQLGGNLGMPVEADGEIWVFGRYDNGAYRWLFDQYGNYSNALSPFHNDYVVSTGESIMYASPIYKSSGTPIGDILTVSIWTKKPRLFNEIGWIDA